MDKNTHYFICGDYMDSTYSQVEDYIYDVIKPAFQFESSAKVKISKAVAGQLKMRKTHASTIVVDEDTKAQLEQVFKFDNITLGCLRVADLA